MKCFSIADCGLNEEYNECGSGCGDLTCDYPSYENLLCPAVCTSGCFCIKGFVRNKGKCIPVKDCECPLNEHSTICGAGCEPTCESPDPNKLICTEICRKGCICDEGYVRNKQGNCVAPEKCSKSLLKNLKLC